MTMTTITPPGAALGPSFEEPFEMLQACHERVDRMLTLLGKLREHLLQFGADEQARQAARDVMRYFDKAGPQHHRDEELHVFPTLLGTQDVDMIHLVARLQVDHLEMASRWIIARSLLEEVVSGMRTRFNEADDAILQAFADMYKEHMRQEEAIAFPKARGDMDTDRLKAMSQEMQARRGVA